MPDMYNSIGTTLEISAGAPATWDSAGYAAVSYSKIGLLGSVGDIKGSWSEDSFNVLETGGTVKTKTFRDAGSIDLTIGYKPADAGQVLLKTAYEDATNNYSFKMVVPGGETKYFQAKVMGYTEQGLDGNFQKLQTSLSIQQDPDGNDIVRVIV